MAPISTALVRPPVSRPPAPPPEKETRALEGLPSLGTLWETVRHLRWRQIRHQLARRLLPPRRRLPPPLPLLWRHLPLRVARGKNTRRVHSDGRRFRFNNREMEWRGDWNDPALRELWLWNLNDMTWMFDLDADGRDEWIRRWREGNPARDLGVGWEPYTISVRLSNWCKHYRLEGREPDAETLGSMGAQAAWLLANPEFHLDANHLLENAFALASIAFVLDPESAAAPRVRERIAAFLAAELDGQFLPDGAHCELSPMYHTHALERLLDLLNAWPEREDPFPGLRQKAEAAALAALDWLSVMSVGGRFSLFNDSAYDSAPDADLVLEYGARLLGFVPRPRSPLRVLEASGYVRAEADPFTLLFDCGPLGPDFQLGHAQGDMLSFCLWMRDEPVLVHPGIYEYLRGPMRDFCRATASHNTVAVDGWEQGDFWAAHRVGRRGRPRGPSAAREADGILRIGGAHDGFAGLPGRPLHERELELAPGRLVVRDRLTADPGRASAAHFHFDPGCTLERQGDRIAIKRSGGNLVMDADRPMRIEESWHCPEYGLRLRNLAVRVECGPEGCRTVLSAVPAAAASGRD